MNHTTKTPKNEGKPKKRGKCSAAKQLERIERGICKRQEAEQRAEERFPELLGRRSSIGDTASGGSSAIRLRSVARKAPETKKHPSVSRKTQDKQKEVTDRYARGKRAIEQAKKGPTESPQEDRNHP